jgi:N-methylhydantoinase B/oxoprolinase/acetone carboxylase alpha subunit
MTFTEWLQTYVPIIFGVLSILGIIFAFIRRVAKTAENFVKTEVQEVIKELRPNGGSSLRDQVNRLEASHEKLEQGHEKLDSKVDTIIDFIINKDNK